MTGKVTLIGLQDRGRWEEATAWGLPGQSWDFAAGLSRMGLEPQLAQVTDGQGEMLLPFVRRSFRGHTDIATLPGLSGALLRPGGVGPLRVWADFARAQGWVAGYLQLAAANAGIGSVPPDRVLRANAMFLFDLDTWDIERSIGHNMRKSLRRAGRDGAVLVTDQARLSRAFPDLHAGALSRIGGTPAFPPEVLSAWSERPLIRFFGAEVGGVLQIAVMCLRKGKRAEGLLTGATPEGRGLHAWMFWQAAECLAAEGVEEFNIGGYGTAGDGLHLMKARLGAREVPMASVRQIYDPAVFAALCAETGADPEADYFPPYRAAAASAQPDDLGSGSDQA